MSVVTQTVNFIRSKDSKDLLHRQFQNLLRDLESDFDNVPYCSE